MVEHLGKTNNSCMARFTAAAEQRLLVATCWIILASCIFTTSAFAASVTLVPLTQTSNLQDAQTVVIDVVIEFKTVGGTLGGGLNISFDSTAIGFVTLVPTGIGDPPFSREPDNLGDVLADWAVGSFNGVSGAQSESLGTIEFEVLPGMGADTLITISGTNGIGGPWISGLDFLSELSPQYNQVELTRAFIKDGFED